MSDEKKDPRGDRRDPSELLDEDALTCNGCDKQIRVFTKEVAAGRHRCHVTCDCQDDTFILMRPFTDRDILLSIDTELDDDGIAEKYSYTDDDGDEVIVDHAIASMDEWRLQVACGDCFDGYLKWLSYRTMEIWRAETEPYTSPHQDGDWLTDEERNADNDEEEEEEEDAS